MGAGRQLTDQSDTGLCLCRPHRRGVHPLHPPGSLSTDKGGRTQQDPAEPRGAEPSRAVLDCGNAPLAPAALPPAALFRCGLAPGPGAVSLGIIKGLWRSRSVTPSPAPAFPQKGGSKEKRGVLPATQLPARLGFDLLAGVPLRLCPSRLISCSESSGSSRKARAGFCRARFYLSPSEMSEQRGSRAALLPALF